MIHSANDVKMILIGIGSNLPSEIAGPPLETGEAALAALAGEDIRLLARSRWYRSAPVPASDQPDYVNGVALVESAHDPVALLAALQRIETAFGRQRGPMNAARTLDLDILAYGDLVRRNGQPPTLPHPRLQGRAFVLLPMAEVAPDWRHPESGLGLAELIVALADPDSARPIG